MPAGGAARRPGPFGTRPLRMIGKRLTDRGSGGCAVWLYTGVECDLLTGIANMPTTSTISQWQAPRYPVRTVFSAPMNPRVRTRYAESPALDIHFLIGFADISDINRWELGRDCGRGIGRLSVHRSGLRAAFAVFSFMRSQPLSAHSRHVNVPSEELQRPPKNGTTTMHHFNSPVWNLRTAVRI